VPELRLRQRHDDHQRCLRLPLSGGRKRRTICDRQRASLLFDHFLLSRPRQPRDAERAGDGADPVSLAARLIGARRGTTAVEFALIALPLLLLLLGIIEFGRMLWTQSALHYAVQEAARCAAVNPGTCAGSSATQNYAVARAGGLNLSPAVFTVSSPAC